MSSDILDLLSRLKIDNTQEKVHFVYYNEETLSIYKISPVKQDSTYKMFSIPSHKVEPILLGENKLDDYTVFFDYGIKNWNIRKKKTESSSISLVEINKNLLEYDLEVTLNSTEVQFNINNTLVKHLKDDSSMMLFVLTEKDNPYRLFTKIEIPLKDLVTDNTHKHQLSDVDIKNGVSIYTNKVFDTYSLGISND